MATNLGEDRFIATPTSQIMSGEGGQAGVWCNYHPIKGNCWLQGGGTEDKEERWPTGTCVCDLGVEKAEPTPGSGGNLTVLSNNLNISGQAISGGSVYFEPEIMLSWPSLQIKAKEDVVIFGGENWKLHLNSLRDDAIVAGRDIILAVGEGGEIDLQGNRSKVFKATGKVEIYADTVLMDSGIQLEDLVETNEIIHEPSKVLYHVVLTGQQQIRGIPGETLSIEVTLANGGANDDSYTLSVSDSAGWTLSGIPATASVKGLEQKVFTLQVTLPQKLGIRDIITINATSQTVSDIETTMEIVVNTTCRVWAIHDDELNNSQLFEIRSNDLQTFDAIKQGNIYEGYDLESLDIHPLTSELYMAASSDALNPGMLYKINLKMNEGIEVIGDIGFKQVDSLSFDSQGVLWGWERGQGLLQIDPLLGIGQLVIPYTEDVQDISWSPDGKLLYAVQGTELLIWDGNTLATQCTLHREIEGIEAITANMLMFGIHGNKNVLVVDIENGCQEIDSIATPFNDIEGIAWSADTCPIQ